MDLLFVVIIVAVVGSIKVYTSGGFVIEESPIMSDDGQVIMPENCRTLGDNLMLKYDKEAFTLILKELGLKK